MVKIPDVKLRDVSEGIIQAVDSSIAPPNSVYLSSNFWFHKDIGRATLREGITQLGNTLTGTCQGLYQFIPSSGTSKLLAVFDNKIHSLETATWTNRTAVASGATVRFETYLNQVVMVDGTNVKSSADGTTWVDTGGSFDVANMPKGKYVIEWKDKIYTAGISSEPDRLYFSSLPITGAVSWTDDTAGYIDISPEDGSGSIVGLSKVPGYLLIFKERTIKRWNGQSTFPEDLINIGTTSQEAIVFARQTVFFWNSRGIFETNGGYPRKISRRIEDIVNAVSSSHSVSGWSDKDNVYFSVGDITLDGLTIKNCVVAYNIDTQTWALFSFPQDFRKWHTYVSSGEHLIAGDTTGKVWKVFDGTADGTANIEWLLQYQTQEFGHRARYKDLSKIILLTDAINSGTVSIRSEAEDFQPFGTFDQNISVICGHKRGRYFDFRLFGSGRGGEIIGLEIPDSAINITQEI